MWAQASAWGRGFSIGSPDKASAVKDIGRLGLFATAVIRVARLVFLRPKFEDLFFLQP